MQRAEIVGLGDGDGADAEGAAAAEHTQRDLATIGDQHPADRCSLSDLAAHMRKIPKRVSGIGASSAAESPSASTCRVSSGSMIPSSQSRAVE